MNEPQRLHADDWKKEEGSVREPKESIARKTASRRGRFVFETAVSLVVPGLLVFASDFVADRPTRLMAAVGLLIGWGNFLDVRLRPARRRRRRNGDILFALSSVVFAGLTIGILSRSIDDRANFLLTAAIVLLLVTGVLAYRLSASQGTPRFGAAVREYGIVIACFVVLAIVAFMVVIAADIATPTGADFRAAVLQGLSGSLVEDLIFFSLLGFILVLLQRRDADRSRNLDDKIELLFSAKTLRSGEASYLREEVRKISADCQEISTSIDVIEHDAERKLLRIDVSRRFYVGNYLSSESAQYTLKVDITPDTVEGHSPSMHLYPTITNSVTRVDGEWRRAADDEVLAQAVDLEGGERYKPPEQHLDIAPGEIREFRTRFQGWQPIYKQDAGDGSSETELDAYEVLMLKHWDAIEVHVRNSLNRPLRVIITGKQPREFELLEGDEQRKAYRVDNLSANSNINISFTPC